MAGPCSPIGHSNLTKKKGNINKRDCYNWNFPKQEYSNNGSYKL